MMLPENPELRDGLFEAISLSLREKSLDVVVLGGDLLEGKSDRLNDSQVDALLRGLRSDSISRVCVSKSLPCAPYFTIRKESGIWKLSSYISHNVSNKKFLVHDMEILSVIMEVEGVEELVLPLGLLEQIGLQSQSVKPEDLVGGVRKIMSENSGNQ